jgi:hypothetical protein
MHTILCLALLASVAWQCVHTPFLQVLVAPCVSRIETEDDLALTNLHDRSSNSDYAQQERRMCTPECAQAYQWVLCNPGTATELCLAQIEDS